jgi:transcriptional regulator with XRE-family HTH domain
LAVVKGRATTPGFRDARYRSVIEQLTAERRRLGLTQEQLAERLGLHKQFVSRVELGERRLDVIEFADFARALGLNPSNMVKSIEPPQPMMQQKRR